MLDRASRYVFISTISVYDFSVPSNGVVDEDFALLPFPAGADPTRKVDEHYGSLKVLCEQVLLERFSECATIVRPGLICGPCDPTDRFTYWPVRVDAGGTVLAPDGPSQPIQYIDARDLAQFVVHLVEVRDGGVYNAVTAPGSLTFGNLLDACVRASNAGASVYWATSRVFERARRRTVG